MANNNNLANANAISEGVINEKQGKDKLQILKKKPLVAWPTVLLLCTTQMLIVATWVLCFNGTLTLWQGCLINICLYYLNFTPAHDAMHRAISRISWVNDLFLYQTALTYLPGNSGKLLGLMHMQHHRFTNDKLDPDHDLVKNKSNMLFLWFFWDFRYLYFYLKNREHYPQFNVTRAVMELILGLSIVAAVAFYHPMEILFLWFIPSRMMVWLICFVFMFLPHAPHSIKDKDAPYQATLIREGWDWLLTPLMMYQNYHLAHHLYPTIPFYRYKKAWRARLEYHEQHNPAKVSAFSIRPYNL
ncbi:MAG: fatty acid desaturase [Pseudomonadales bacterium]|nr:fatty acid desaturase [Pseudomonadales bacterium]